MHKLTDHLRIENIPWQTQLQQTPLVEGAIHSKNVVVLTTAQILNRRYLIPEAETGN